MDTYSPIEERLRVEVLSSNIPNYRQQNSETSEADNVVQNELLLDGGANYESGMHIPIHSRALVGRSSSTLLQAQQYQRTQPRKSGAESSTKTPSSTLQNCQTALNAQSANSDDEGQQRQFQVYEHLSRQAVSVLQQRLIDTTLTERKKLPPIRLKNGTTYEGEWFEGKKHGEGKLIFGKHTYTGQWKDNRANGYGCLQLFAGEKSVETSNNSLVNKVIESYEGEWLDDRAHGEGKYTCGEFCYEGEWKNDQFQGEGVLEVFGESIYEGSFCFGMKHGRGCMKFLQDGSRYEGDFSMDDFCGRGTFFMRDRRYDAEWSENKLNGSAVVTYADGRIFRGTFCDDKKNGVGILTWPDGRSLRGIFTDNKIEGEFVYRDSDGKIRTGEWQDGVGLKWLE